MSLLAGAATGDLTPGSPVQLCGYPHIPRISNGIHDPLLVSALYLRNGDSDTLLCALDLIMLNCDVARRIRRRVAAAICAPEANVLISCTHTHSGPVTLDYLPFGGDVAMPPRDPGYLELVERRVVETALAAKKRATPASLAWTTANALGLGGNRLARDGETDPEAGVLCVRGDSGFTAIVVMYGMHPTVLHEDSELFSADFPHYTRLFLQEKFGRETVVVYHTGAAGDQSPRYYVKGQTFGEAERLGRGLGAAVSEAISKELSFTANPILSGWSGEASLKRRQLPDFAQARKTLHEYQTQHEHLVKTGAERAAIRTAEVASFGAEAVLRLCDAERSGRLDALLSRVQPFEVQVLRIGDHCVAALPGEIFSRYGLEIKRRAAAKTVIVTYANGELQGYIVTPEAAAARGYESMSRVFDPEAGVKLVELALEGVRALMEKEA